MHSSQSAVLLTMAIQDLMVHYFGAQMPIIVNFCKRFPPFVGFFMNSTDYHEYAQASGQVAALLLALVRSLHTHRPGAHLLETAAQNEP